MSEPDLARALDGARRGDDASIGVLYRRLQPQVLRYLARRAPGREEDLASETWLGVARQLSAFQGGVEDFRVLLFVVARRRLADEGRRRRRSLQTVAIDEHLEPPSPASEEIALENLSAQEAIDNLTAALPPLQAEVVLLRVVADLAVPEVARVMGRSPGAIRVLQHRALRRLATSTGRLTVTS